jgi:hypothetical protein
MPQTLIGFHPQGKGRCVMVVNLPEEDLGLGLEVEFKCL